MRECLYRGPGPMRYRHRADMHAAGPLHAMGDHDDLRAEPDMRRHGHVGIVYVQRLALHAVREGVPGRPDDRHLCDGREQLPVPGFDDGVRRAAGVLGDGAERGLFGHVLGHLHARPNVVRIRRPGDLHPRGQRLLGLHRARRMRLTRELHRGCRVRKVHMQHGLRVQATRQRMSGWPDGGHLRDRRE